MFYWCKRDLQFKMLSIYGDPRHIFTEDEEKDVREFEQRFIADGKRRERERKAGYTPEPIIWTKKE